MRAALGARRRRADDDAGRADAGDPAGAGRPALERRHRHLRQGADRDPRRGRRQGQRRDPGRRRASCARSASARAATSASPSAAASSTPSSGGRINTDFIDNSAGVDTSDHEVNIKILLDRVVADGDLTEKQRNELLASMTDEVGDAGAARQLRAEPRAGQRRGPGAVAAARARGLDAHGSSAQGLLDRELEALPTPREVAGRLERSEGLTAPELSVLLAYTKIVLADELLATDLPDDPFLRIDLFALLPDADAPGLPRARWRATRCAARSSSPRWSTTWSTAPASPSSTGWPARPAPAPAELTRAQLRGPRDLRRRARCSDEIDVARQPARRRRADPDAARDAHAGRAGVPLAGQQPPRRRWTARRPSTSSGSSSQQVDGRAARRC